MVSVSVEPGAYQDLAQLRERIDYQGGDFFDDNEALRFDKLLVRLEQESRKIFETLWGDETVLTETERVDVIRATDDKAIPLVYPVTDIREVEYKIALSSDYETLDADKYDRTEHRLILADRPTANSMRIRQQRANSLTRFAAAATWGDLATKLRVTYNRGFGSEAPSDVKQIQVQLVNRQLRHLKREQTVAAASPEELAGQADAGMVVNDDIRQRVADVTSPSRATQSI